VLTQKSTSRRCVSPFRPPPPPANPRAQNVIQITRPPVPVYQTVIEKTRGLVFRAQAMGVALERTAHAPAAPPAEAAPAPVSAAA
jgi:hypothetical protein